MPGQEPGTPSRLPMCVAGTQLLQPSKWKPIICLGMNWSQEPELKNKPRNPDVGHRCVNCQPKYLLPQYLYIYLHELSKSPCAMCLIIAVAFTPIYILSILQLLLFVLVTQTGVGMSEGDFSSISIESKARAFKICISIFKSSQKMFIYNCTNIRMPFAF